MRKEVVFMIACEETGSKALKKLNEEFKFNRPNNGIDVATKAGSRGGTIINARGSGIHETSKVFAMEIEPEKEVVIIVSKEDKTNAIVSSIRKQLNIDEPGNGVIYVQDINETYGLYED